MHIGRIFCFSCIMTVWTKKFGGMVYNFVIATPTELNESLPVVRYWCAETQNKLHFQLTDRLYRGTDWTSNLITVKPALKGTSM